MIRVQVPVRVADVGGWTDTWFARSGAVCHLAVGPGVRVSAEEANRVHLDAPDVGAHYDFDASAAPGSHPLLEQAVLAALPPGAGARFRVRSDVPPGGSLGTSAAVVVAIIRAASRLFELDRDPADEARLAHSVEVDRLGRESGVQDQWAAAFGGAGLLEVHYPEATRTPIALPDPLVEELGARLVTVFVGEHDSSAVHRSVIAAVHREGASHPTAAAALDELAALARQSADRLGAGDLVGWGDALTAATEAQRRLQAGLVGPRHQALIELARRHGAWGWKVNGAGGSGGTLTVLTGSRRAAREYAEAAGRLGRVLPLVPAR